MKDEFSWSSDAWVLPSYQAEWRKSVKNGEMTLNAANAQYPAIKFHDYVLEVTARQVKADWHGFEFSNTLTGDSGFRCTFMIWNDLRHFGCGAIRQQTDFLNLRFGTLRDSRHPDINLYYNPCQDILVQLPYSGGKPTQTTGLPS